MARRRVATSLGSWRSPLDGSFRTSISQCWGSQLSGHCSFSHRTWTLRLARLICFCVERWRQAFPPGMEPTLDFGSTRSKGFQFDNNLQILAGAAIIGAGFAFLALTNWLRFGSIFEFGHRIHISSEDIIY